MKRIKIKMYDEGYFYFDVGVWCNWETKDNGLAIRRNDKKTLISFYEGAQFMVKNTWKEWQSSKNKNIYLICG